MGLKKILLWIAVLTFIELAIRTILNFYYIGVDSVIIPNFLDFRPTANVGMASMNIWKYIPLCIYALAVLLLYRYLKKKSLDTKYLDVSFILIFSAILVSFISNIFNNDLSYIYLKHLFVFSLNDIYLVLGVVVFIIYLFQKIRKKNQSLSV
jgi:lipoprotein signal peptidase